MDHGPTVLSLWQLTPQPCNDASELIIIRGGGKIKDLSLQRVRFSFHITVLSLPPQKSLLSQEITTDKLIFESVDVEDDDIQRVLEGLLLLWIIISQSVCLVPWLLLSPFQRFPGNNSVLWGVFPWKGSKSFPQDLLSTPRNPKVDVGSSYKFLILISTSLAINKSSNEDVISSMPLR